MSTITPVRLFQSGIVFLCLLLPSIWMVLTIPPLWRDLDAYVQLTENPLVVTFWGHAPAYSYVAKPFLFVGEHWERWRDPFNHLAGSSQPRLTDTGIWLLVISQHLALAAGAYYFIRAASRFFWVQLALALLWPSNALFYTYAQCLGSETLGLILITVLATLGLRLIQSREPQWTDWYAFALVLALCILSRELNLGLIALLPAAFLLSWAQNRASIFGLSADRPRPWLRRAGGRYLRHAVVAMAIGLACVVIANSLKTNLARKTRFHPHSRIGFTFLWRLNFLDSLSPEARSILLRKVAGRTHSTEARQMIALVEQMKAEKGGMSAAPFMQRAILLFDGRKWEELDRALNKMAFAFLLPPTPEHLQATKNDLLYALKMPPTEITSYLFATTAYYFEHKDKMLQCANLVTFRDSTAAQITQVPSEHFYFRLWQRLDYHRVFVIWLVALVVFVVASRRSKGDGKAITAFGIALTAVGLLLCLTACLLDELEPRFASSMWQLSLLSIYLFLGKTADLIIEGKVRRAAVRPEP